MAQVKFQRESNDGAGSLAERGAALKTAATDWASGLKDVAREQVVVQGRRTEEFVRSHPGRFILGACCVGLAAGWLLGRGRKS